jgi:hypothetical protein
MRTLRVLTVNLGLILILFLREAMAQQGSMMSGGMPVMGGTMMVGMGIFWVLLLVIMVLTILVLIKQLRK